MNLGDILKSAVNNADSTEWNSTLVRVEALRDEEKKLMAQLESERAEWRSRFQGISEKQYALRARIKAQKDAQQKTLLQSQLRRAESEFWAIYDEYLHSRAWQYKRQEALKRDEFDCQHCGSPATEIHHITYTDLGNELTYQLLSLCASCHTRLHKKRDDDRAADRELMVAHQKAGTLKAYLDEKYQVKIDILAFIEKHDTP
jgi:5-methylcytosine-specific restriction endonuclease McrA